MQQVKVSVAGFGGVGRATAKLLLERRERYRAVYGADVRLVAVCGSRAGLQDPQGLEADRFDALEDGLTGPDFIIASGTDIVIEAGPTDIRTGGPGLAYLTAALAEGRDVIAISKGALVHSGGHLRDLAARSGALLKISGAAAAALPTIDLVAHSLLGCTVLKVEGILNATTNFLLDAMTQRGVDFAEALSEAQDKGFAEADPRNDTQGWDTAAKLLILANFGLGLNLSLQDVAIRGIDGVTRADLANWKQNGVAPRLVGSLVREGNAMRAEVGIRTYRANDPFALVSGKNKAIRIISDAMGETLAIGAGTEPLATAAAALKDFEHILILRAGGRTAQRMESIR